MRAAALAAVLALGTLAPGAADAGGIEIAVNRDATGSFALVAHTGKRVTERDFGGRFLLVYFGYTSCPDVCPTDLLAIGEAIKQLGEAGKRVQPLFVTVDPERDSAEVLARYVTHFHPRFFGLTGTPEEVAIAAQNFGAIHVKAVGREGRYTVDHSAFTYLLGPDARFRAAFEHGAGPGRLAAAIRKHLQGLGR